MLANLALSVLDDAFAEKWRRDSATTYDRVRRRRQGLATYRLIRYADDFVVLVSGTREQAEGLWQEVAAILAPAGLRLAPNKTKVVHIDEGFDFLGFRIRRDTRRGGSKKFIYTYPSLKALSAIKRKVKMITQRAINSPLADLLKYLGSVLRGWAMYFRHGASHATFAYLGAYTWRRVWRWMRRKHPKASWKWLRHHYMPNRWVPEQDGIRLFNPASIKINRYRYRGTAIPSPWSPAPATT